MNRRLTGMTLLMIVGAVIGMAGLTLNSTTGAQPTADDKKKGDYTPVYVCPIYPWAVHEDYTSYYSFICDEEEPVNFDGDHSLPLNYGCPSDKSNCILVEYPSLTLAKELKVGPRGNGLKIGNKHIVQTTGKRPIANGYRNLNKKRKKHYEPDRIESIASVLSRHQVAIEKTGVPKFYAELVTYAITPPDPNQQNKELPTLYATVGYEIDNPGTILIPIGGENVRKINGKPKLLLVKHNNAWFRVIKMK